MDASRLKEVIRGRFALVTGLPVTWCDERFSHGDFEGRDATLELFDVAAGSEWDLQRRLRELRKSASAVLGAPLRLMFHTPAATTRVYPWVRDLAPPPALRHVGRSGRTIREDLDFVLRLVRRVWPDAIVDDTGRGVPDRPILNMFPVHRSSEMLIFRDDASRDTWNIRDVGKAERGPVLVVRTDDEELVFTFWMDTMLPARMVDEIVTALENRRMGPLQQRLAA